MKLTREDIIKYIIKIQLNFDNAYATSNDFERELLVESWMEILEKYPKEVCDIAVNNALEKAKFAPRIGDITEEICRLNNSFDKTDNELWAEIRNVSYNVYYISKYLQYPHYFNWATKKLDEIYNSLSDDIKLYIVDVSTLIEISSMTEESLSYERNRFFKQMPELRKHAANKVMAQKILEQINQSDLSLKDNSNTLKFLKDK